MPAGTTYNPQHVSDFEKSKLNANGQHAKGLATLSADTDFDYQLTDDCLYTGIWLSVMNGLSGDSAKLQVIDTNGITGAPPGTVLMQAANYGIPGFNFSEQFEYGYPAKILATMTIRLIYTSTAGLLGTQPYVIANHKLHKCLV